MRALWDKATWEHMEEGRCLIALVSWGQEEELVECWERKVSMAT